LSDRDQLLGERFDHAGDAVVDLGQRGCQPMPLAGGWFGGACAAQPGVSRQVCKPRVTQDRPL